MEVMLEEQGRSGAGGAPLSGAWVPTPQFHPFPGPLHFFLNLNHSFSTSWWTSLTSIP